MDKNTLLIFLVIITIFFALLLSKTSQADNTINHSEPDKILVLHNSEVTYTKYIQICIYIKETGKKPCYFVKEE